MAQNISGSLFTALDRCRFCAFTESDNNNFGPTAEMKNQSFFFTSVQLANSALVKQAYDLTVIKVLELTRAQEGYGLNTTKFNELEKSIEYYAEAIKIVERELGFGKK